MNEHQPQTFDEFVNEAENQLFMKTKFKEMGKEDDLLFQSLVFLQKAKSQMVVSHTVASQDESIPGDLIDGFAKIIDDLVQMEDIVRKRMAPKDGDTVDKIHRIEIIATAGIGMNSFFELHFHDKDDAYYQTKIVSCDPLKRLGVMKRVSASKAERWLNTEEGKRWAFAQPGRRLF